MESLFCGCCILGRPAFTGTDRVTTEDFFLESLNAWREKQGLKSFILVGHSLGKHHSITGMAFAYQTS